MSTKARKQNPEAAIERISTQAFSDEGYRAQLVNLADSHGGIYAAALEALYAIEYAQLTPVQAVARVDRDRELLRNIREKERRRMLLAAINAAGELVEASEKTARAIRADHRAKLVDAALADDVCRQRLEELAKKRVKRSIYREALRELKDHPNAGDRDP